MKRNRRALALWKKLIFSATAILFFFISLEIISPFIFPERNLLLHKEHEGLLKALGLPALNQTMEFDPFLFWKLKENIRDFRVSGKIREFNFDFTVNTNNGLRSAPISQQKKGLRLLAVGDSTTFGLGVNDSQTWPSQLQKMLSAKGFQAEVVNAGVPGYTAFQGKRFLEKTGLSLEPDIVIVNFGFNDYDIWGSRSDMETASDLAIKRWESFLIKSRFYRGLKTLLYPTPSDKNIASSNQINKVSQKKENSKKRSRLSPGEYLKTMKDIHTLNKSKNIKTIFVIWPYNKQVSQKDSNFILYQKILAKMCGVHRFNCVNLIDPFIDENKSLFIDHIHANVEGCELAAKSLLSAIIPMIKTRSF